jgi:hypothetical protein
VVVDKRIIGTKPSGHHSSIELPQRILAYCQSTGFGSCRGIGSCRHWTGSGTSTIFSRSGSSPFIEVSVS